MHRHFPYTNKRSIGVLAVALALICAIAACRQHGAEKVEADSAPSQSVSQSNSSDGPASGSTVQLSAGQLRAVTIEPIGTYSFPNDKEEIGSVSFDEAPAIVQDESALLGAAATSVLTAKELGRARDLYSAGNAVAQRELEQAISDQQTAAATLKAARETVRADGKTDAEIDQMIAAGSIDIVQAADKSIRWVVTNVPESDIPLFHVGQEIDVKVEAYSGRDFKGTISRIYAAVDPNTHRVAIRGEVSDPQNELRPGMLAKFSIRYAEPEQAIAIPEKGVVREGDGTMSAWVTTDRQHFIQRKINVGVLRDGRYQVLEGLRSGELAVTDGGVFLSNILEAPPTE